MCHGGKSLDSKHVGRGMGQVIVVVKTMSMEKTKLLGKCEHPKVSAM